jgi:hypothetical protein
MRKPDEILKEIFNATGDSLGNLASSNKEENVEDKDDEI